MNSLAKIVINERHFWYVGPKSINSNFNIWNTDIWFFRRFLQPIFTLYWLYNSILLRCLQEELQFTRFLFKYIRERISVCSQNIQIYSLRICLAAHWSSYIYTIFLVYTRKSAYTHHSIVFCNFATHTHTHEHRFKPIRLLMWIFHFSSINVKTKKRCKKQMITSLQKNVELWAAYI